MANSTTILQVLPGLESGGVERGTIEIAQAVAAAGMRSLVASGGGALVPLLKRVEAEHHTLPLGSKNPWVIWRNVARLVALIRAHDVKLIHARSRAPAWSAYLAAKRTGIAFVTTFHGAYGTDGLLKKRYNAVMAKGERVIAISEFVCRYIVEHYPVNPELLRLIPRGVDLALFDERRTLPARIHELTQSWLLPDEAIPVILFPARLSPVKQQAWLIEALATLKDRAFLCILMGKDDGHEHYTRELEELIVKLGLEERVRIRGATQAMTEAYMLSDIVIGSLRAEPFGRVAIEAQAMGKLVIATDEGGSRETIIQNETGYLVPPGDTAALAQAIRFALERDQATTQAMASHARQHVRHHFSSALMKERTLTVYRELLT